MSDRLVQLEALFRERYPIFRDVVSRARSSFSPRWADECADMLDRLLPTPEALERAVAGYVAFAVDIMRRQAAFERTRRYDQLSYAAAVETVYSDDAYMTSEYLPGLLLSHYLWPHHYRQAMFFDSAFATQVALASRPAFAEIGVGTGIYSRRLLELIPDATGTGFDISASSLEFATRHVADYGYSARYRAVNQDVIATAAEPVDWLVCVEVLEHLEDPPALLRALRTMLAPGGCGFITAAINAPNIDHIYLYEDAAAVVSQIEAAGFALEQAFIGPAHAPRAPGLPVPTVAAFVVR